MLGQLRRYNIDFHQNSQHVDYTDHSNSRVYEEMQKLHKAN